MQDEQGSLGIIPLRPNMTSSVFVPRKNMLEVGRHLPLVQLRRATLPIGRFPFGRFAPKREGGFWEEHGVTEALALFGRIFVGRSFS